MSNTEEIAELQRRVSRMERTANGRLPTEWIDVVLDGPPGPEAGRFVEVEDQHGHSISVGRWVEPGMDQFWRLRITVDDLKPTGAGHVLSWSHARALAKRVAVRHRDRGNSPSYLKDAGLPEWNPHAWVVEAIMEASRGRQPQPENWAEVTRQLGERVARLEARPRPLSGRPCGCLVEEGAPCKHFKPELLDVKTATLDDLDRLGRTRVSAPAEAPAPQPTTGPSFADIGKSPGFQQVATEGLMRDFVRTDLYLKRLLEPEEYEVMQRRLIMGGPHITSAPPTDPQPDAQVLGEEAACRLLRAMLDERATPEYEATIVRTDRVDVQVGGRSYLLCGPSAVTAFELVRKVRPARGENGALALLVGMIGGRRLEIRLPDDVAPTDPREADLREAAQTIDGLRANYAKLSRQAEETSAKLAEVERQLAAERADNATIRAAREAVARRVESLEEHNREMFQGVSTALHRLGRGDGAGWKDLIHAIGTQHDRLRHLEHQLIELGTAHWEGVKLYREANGAMPNDMPAVHAELVRWLLTRLEDEKRERASHVANIEHATNQTIVGLQVTVKELQDIRAKLVRDLEIARHDREQAEQDAEAGSRALTQRDAALAAVASIAYMLRVDRGENVGQTRDRIVAKLDELLATRPKMPDELHRPGHARVAISIWPSPADSPLLDRPTYAVYVDMGADSLAKFQANAAHELAKLLATWEQFSGGSPTMPDAPKPIPKHEDLARRIRESDYIREFASWQGDGDWLRESTDGDLLDHVFARLNHADRMEGELGGIMGLVHDVLADTATPKERVAAGLERARAEGRREADVERAGLVAKLQLVREALGATLQPDGTDDVVDKARASRGTAEILDRELEWYAVVDHVASRLGIGCPGSPALARSAVLDAVSKLQHDLETERKAHARNRELLSQSNADHNFLLVQLHRIRAALRIEVDTPWQTVADAAIALRAKLDDIKARPAKFLQEHGYLTVSGDDVVVSESIPRPSEHHRPGHARVTIAIWPSTADQPMFDRPEYGVSVDMGADSLATFQANAANELAKLLATWGKPGNQPMGHSAAELGKRDGKLASGLAPLPELPVRPWGSVAEQILRDVITAVQAAQTPQMPAGVFEIRHRRANADHPPRTELHVFIDKGPTTATEQVLAYVELGQLYVIALNGLSGYVTASGYHSGYRWPERIRAALDRK